MKRGMNLIDRHLLGCFFYGGEFMGGMFVGRSGAITPGSNRETKADSKANAIKKMGGNDTQRGLLGLVAQRVETLENKIMRASSPKSVTEVDVEPQAVETTGATKKAPPMDVPAQVCNT